MPPADRARSERRLVGGPMSRPFRLVTVCMLALVTIIAFEAMAISTAMPVVARDLAAVRSYGLAFSFFLTAELLGIVLAGTWSDRGGPLRPLLTGTTLLAAGSALAGLAWAFPVLLLGRIVAGTGAGLNVVALYVVIGHAYPDALRPRVFSWVSAAWVLPALVGPPISGWITHMFSWRWVFLVVLAPIAVTFTLVVRQRGQFQRGERPESVTAGADAPVPSGSPSGPPRRGGRAARTVWLGVLVAVCAGVVQWGADQLVPLRLGPVVAVAIGLVGMAVAAPRLVTPGAVRMARGLPSVMSSRFLLTASFNGAMTFVPLMLVAERDLSLTVAGVMLTLGSLGWSAGAFLQGRDALHGRRSELVAAGGAFLAAGILLLAAIAEFGWHTYLVPVAATLTGVGMGMAMSAVSVLALALSTRQDRGRASSSLNLADVLGSVIGLSLSGAVFAALHHQHGSDAPVFALMWALLAVLAAGVVIGGQRTRT
ncbi:MAG TPA: MFS transporter [Segeticoccus sp.]|uniref:MFS transporter n=1 Tax=Segeticoccus sp. TaxID=2706531 RepID=UPI002D803869|nr:MFS transporter [Segeticoccus sp.]HET8602096.1 MFS transporter [Segeticoccus sp.]